MRSGIGVGEHVEVENVVVCALIFGNAAVPIESSALVNTISSNPSVQLGTYINLKGEREEVSYCK